MRGSLRRMAEATEMLELVGAEPSHMLTLTIPLDAWEAVKSPRAWAEAKARFWRRWVYWARKHGYGRVGYFHWVEFTKKGVPHLHALFDLGGRLEAEAWETLARELIPTWWLKALREAGFPVESPPRTRLEALRHRDFRYARSYALKREQKDFPFPGAWGRAWDTGGSWREELARARRRDAEEAVSVCMDTLDWIVFKEALLEVMLRRGIWVVPRSLVPFALMSDFPQYAASRVHSSPEARSLLIEALLLTGKLDGTPLPDWIKEIMEEPGPPTPLGSVDDGGPPVASRGPGGPPPCGGSRGGAGP
jgi:hypothetical protein